MADSDVGMSVKFKSICEAFMWVCGDVRASVCLYLLSVCICVCLYAFMCIHYNFMYMCSV